MSTDNKENIQQNVQQNASNQGIQMNTVRQKLEQLRLQSKQTDMEPDEWSCPFFLTEKEKEHRASLVQQVQTNMQDPATWLQLIYFDLGKYKQHSDVDKGVKHMIRMYTMATQRVNKDTFRKSEEFLVLWMAYVKLLWNIPSEMENAKKIFKFLVSEGIGVQFRAFYLFWAEFEVHNGNLLKAKQILAKGFQKKLLHPDDLKQLNEKLTKNGYLSPATQIDIASLPTERNNTAEILSSSRPKRFYRQDINSGARRVKLEEAEQEEAATESAQPRADPGIPTASPQTEHLNVPTPQPSRDKENMTHPSTYSNKNPSTPHGIAPRVTAPRVSFAEAENKDTSAPPSTAAYPEATPQTIEPAYSHPYSDPKSTPVRKPDPPSAIPPSIIPPSSIPSSIPSSHPPSSIPPPAISSSTLPPSSSSVHQPLSVSFQDVPSKESFSTSSSNLNAINNSNASSGSNTSGSSSSSSSGGEISVQSNNSLNFQRLSSNSHIPVATPSSAGAPIPFDIVREWSDEIIMVSGKPYVKLACVGKGGSSKVFKVMSKDLNIYALKRVTLQAEPTILQTYLNEIDILKQLKKHKTIIHYIDAEINEKEEVLFIVLEYGELDLNRMLQQHGDKFNENFLRHCWHQMLESVHTIHEERIVHGDLKPANFVFVQGTLKLIDFGIAKAIQNDTTNIVRENQIGTINYISPEALIDINDGNSGQQLMKLGRASDIWSLGCILFQMAFGKPPFAHLNMLKKLQCITDPKYEIPFPKCNDPLLLDVLKRCLQRDPKLRPTIPDLLRHPFLHPSWAFAQQRK